MKTSNLSKAMALLAGLLLSGALPAATTSLPQLADLQSVGEARMQVLFWKVYDAQLLAPNGEWSPDDPYALVLTYLRDLKGKAIAERSIAEIRQQGRVDESTLARWQQTLHEIFPDVRARTEIVGLVDDEAHTRFFLDGELIGEVRDPAFTQAFFGIWLDERTSQPELRRRLLGAA
jgi:hypothetical protein